MGRHGARGGVDSWRRHAHRATDAARRAPRRVLGDPPAWRSARRRSASSPRAGSTLADHGLEWVHPDVPLAHPLDGGRAAVLARDVDETADGLGADGAAYRRLFGPLVEAGFDLTDGLLSPFAIPPRHPLTLARYGVTGIRGAEAVARRRFATDEARALFAGLSGHSILPLDKAATAGYGLMLGVLAHLVGWPMARGGSQRIAECPRRAAGETPAARWSATRPSRRSPSCRPPTRSCSTSRRASWWRSPATALPRRYRTSLDSLPLRPRRVQARLGARRPDPVDQPGRGPSRRPSTSAGRSTRSPPPRPPRMPVSTPSARSSCSPSSRCSTPIAPPPARTRRGRTATCPNGSTVDMTDRIEAQVERFAPGFRDRILGAPHDGHRRDRTPRRQLHRRRHQRRQRPTCASSSPARRSACTHGGRRSTASTCARAARRLAAECTACAAGTPPTRCCDARH